MNNFYFIYIKLGVFKLYKSRLSKVMFFATAVIWLPYLQVSFCNTILTFISPRVMQPDRVAVETIIDLCHKVYSIDTWNLKTIYKTSVYILLEWGIVNVGIIRFFCQVCISKPES